MQARCSAYRWAKGSQGWVIGRINRNESKALEEGEDAANYNGTDHIGKEGLEKSYEKQLHGTTGYEEVEVSAGGRAMRTLSRTAATPGNNLILSIEKKKKKVVEEVGEWRGAAVAITRTRRHSQCPAGYDPNRSSTDRPAKWDELKLRRRCTVPVRHYAPVRFKPFMALAALELGKRTPSQSISDPGFFILGGHTFRDDKVGGHGTVDMHKSIVVSCNTYYYQLGRDMGIDAIHDFMKPFGFGQLTGIDLNNEKTGVLPSTEWKRNRFKTPQQKKWVGGDTISVSNGSGYNSYTPLQIAHATANLANNGVVMKPHLVKIIEDAATRARTLTVPKESYRIPLKQENIDTIKRAMVGVTSEQGGTAARIFTGVQYTVGGKTGTAQVVGIKKNEKYMPSCWPSACATMPCLRPSRSADKTRIAIAIVVENAGFGAGVAAPIARKALDYYLLASAERQGKGHHQGAQGRCRRSAHPEEITDEQAARHLPGNKEAHAH